MVLLVSFTFQQFNYSQKYIYTHFEYLLQTQLTALQQNSSPPIHNHHNNNNTINNDNNTRHISLDKINTGWKKDRLVCYTEGEFLV